MNGLNLAILGGEITDKPELTYTPDGKAKLRLRMKITDGYRDAKTDQWKDRTTYMTVVVWGRSADALAPQLNQGMYVTVQGRIAVRFYENKAGQKVTATEVVADRVVFAGAPSGVETAADDQPEEAGT